MDKRMVARHLLDNISYSKEQRNIMEAVEEARIQLQNAQEFFETVTEPKLIDYAIYMEEAAKAKYVFLIEEAKRLNLKASYEAGAAKETAV
jgi:hypothetical protein